MLKKLLIICLVTVALVGVSYAQGSIGINIPFLMESSSEGNAESVSGSEMWTGGLVTFEYMVWPTFSIGLEGGYLMSLGGSIENGEKVEFKNNMIPVSALIRYYFPMAEDAQFHPYLGCGAGFWMVTLSFKTNGDYEKFASETFIFFPEPRLFFGFDYDIAEAMKLGGVFDFGFQSVSYSPETSESSKNGAGDYSMSTFRIGLGLTFKYCF